MESAGPAPLVEVSSLSGDTLPSRVEVIHQLVRKAGFSRVVAKVAVADLRHSTTALYQSKWSRFLHWYHKRDVIPCKASVQQVGEFSLYMRRDLGLFVLV